MGKRKADYTPKEWKDELAKRRQKYAEKNADRAKPKLDYIRPTKISIQLRLKPEVYNRMEIIAEETEARSVHGAIVQGIEEYVNAWFAKQSLLDMETTHNDPLGFILLSLLKSITEDNEQFRSILASALDAKRRYGSVSDYLRQYDDDD